MPREKGSREQKHSGHNQIDKEARVMSPFISARDRNDMTTAIYKLWNGALADKLGGDVSGIKDKYAGPHHLSRLEAQYFPVLEKFKHYILYDRFPTNDRRRGNVNEYTTTLIKWKSDIELCYKNVSEDQKDKVILEFLKKDPLVTKIREYLKLGQDSQIKFDIKEMKQDVKEKKQDIKQEKPKKQTDKCRPLVWTQHPQK